METAKRLTILAFGHKNSSDNSAALLALEGLKKLYRCDDRVCLMCIEKCDGLPGIFSESSYVIIIDTGKIDQDAGCYVRSPLDELKISGRTRFSRNADLAGIFAAEEHDGLEIPETVFYIIQPKELEIGSAMSDEVKDAIKDIITDIDAEIQDVLGDG